MATRKNVAQLAGVSEATVSHVINGTKYVSPDLEQKVRKAIISLNYRPNIIARSLVTKTTRHIAILVSDLKNPYYAEITEGMQDVAQKEGYIVSLIRYGSSSDDVITDLAYRYVDGLFILTPVKKLTSVEKQSREYGIAVVSDVVVNYSRAIDEMIGHLVGLGHTKIGFLSGLPIETPDHDRYISYRLSLENHGICFDPSLVVNGVEPYNTTIAAGYDAMNALLSTRSDVSAVFAANDLMAIGALRAIRDAGFRVPEDISVVGCDDIFLADSVDPPLTTLRVPKFEMGRKAMYQMLSQIRENRHEPAVVDAEFVIRDTTSIVRR